MAGSSGNRVNASSPIVSQIPASIDLLDLHRRDPDRYPFLLESSASGEPLGRYDVLFAFPGPTLLLDADYRLSGPGAGKTTRFLEALDRWWLDTGTGLNPKPEPFTGGWFVYLGYELAQEIEPSLALQGEPGVPVAFATRVPVAIIRDRVKGKAWIVAEPGQSGMLDLIKADLLDLEEPDPNRGRSIVDGSVIEEPPEQFLAAVQKAQTHITRGDIYQANLSRVWRSQLQPNVRAGDLYARLRETNPAPFAGLAVRDDFAVISSSPERLLRLRGGRIETRPIAGTRPRDEHSEASNFNKDEFLGNPKERAEHIMLIDLERNDLGRICNPGSVSVDEFMTIETYAHVHHIVSTVTGRPRDKVTPGQMISAVFPGGSITGCPKVRCMEIIRDIEGRPRGPYTGAMGYLNRDGSCDFNILIRTVVANGRSISVAAGSGIVADSDPCAELEETRAKAIGVLLALAA